MDTLLHLIETTIQSYLKTQIYENGLMLAKAVATLLILMELINSYFKNMDDPNSIGFKMSDLVKPAMYILGICYFNNFHAFIENITDAFFNNLDNGKPMYQALLQAKKNLSDTKITIFNLIPKVLFRLVTDYLSIKCCWLLGVVDIIIYSAFIAERYFLVGIANLIFPFLLAASAHNWFKDYLKKGYKAYIAVLVSIYILKLTMSVGQKLFEKIKGLLSGTEQMIDSEILRSLGKLEDFAAILIAGFIAIVIKIKLIKSGITYLNRVLS